MLTNYAFVIIFTTQSQKLLIICVSIVYFFVAFFLIHTFDPNLSTKCAQLCLNAAHVVFCVVFLFSLSRLRIEQCNEMFLWLFSQRKIQDWIITFTQCASSAVSSIHSTNAADTIYLTFEHEYWVSKRKVFWTISLCVYRVWSVYLLSSVNVFYKLFLILLFLWLVYGFHERVKTENKPPKKSRHYN